jgi:DMSO/TMAO reductase YedYZ molybdopterin-dependent catalytic subunit
MKNAASLVMVTLLALSCSSLPELPEHNGLDPGLGPGKYGILPVVNQPLFPDLIPGYTELDPQTGLHMTGTPQLIQVADYQLKITGNLENPVSLSFDDIRRLPRLSAKPALICKGYFEDYANWAGASLSAVLDLVKPGPGSSEVILVGADGYTTWLSLDDARSPDAFLAYELEGKALPVLHGFPLRAVFPALTGNKWAKWLLEIQVQ